MENENNGKKEYTIRRGSLILRIVVSAYLLYTVYQLFGSLGTATGTDKIVVVIAMIIFTVVAVPLGFFSLRAMSRGEYTLPGADQEESEEEISDTIDSEVVADVDANEENLKEDDTVE